MKKLIDDLSKTRLHMGLDTWKRWEKNGDTLIELDMGPYLGWRGLYVPPYNQHIYFIILVGLEDWMFIYSLACFEKLWQLGSSMTTIWRIL